MRRTCLAGVGVLLIACGEPHGGAPGVTPVPEDPSFVPPNAEGVGADPVSPGRAPGAPNPAPVMGGGADHFEPTPDAPSAGDQNAAPGGVSGGTVGNGSSPGPSAPDESSDQAPDAGAGEDGVAKDGAGDAGVSFGDAGSVTDAGSAAMDARFGASPSVGDASASIESP